MYILFGENCTQWLLHGQNLRVEYWRKLSQIFLFTLFFKQRFFSTQPQCCLTLLWIELQVLLRCCLIHIIKLFQDIFYVLYFYPCLGLGLFMSYLCDLFFIFSLVFFTINLCNLIQTDALVFCTFFRISSIIFGW